MQAYRFDQLVTVDFFAKAEKEREFLPLVTQEIGGAQPLYWGIAFSCCDDVSILSESPGRF